MTSTLQLWFSASSWQIAEGPASVVVVVWVSEKQYFDHYTHVSPIESLPALHLPPMFIDCVKANRLLYGLRLLCLKLGGGGPAASGGGR